MKPQHILLFIKSSPQSNIANIVLLHADNNFLLLIYSLHRIANINLFDLIPVTLILKNTKINHKIIITRRRRISLNIPPLIWIMDQKTIHIILSFFSEHLQRIIHQLMQYLSPSLDEELILSLSLLYNNAHNGMMTIEDLEPVIHSLNLWILASIVYIQLTSSMSWRI